MRFVIQKHTLSNNNEHYDIMFEEGNTLKTYQISASIESLLQSNEVMAKNIQDHRLIYLDYEGEISDNRGVVKIFDRGNYVVKTKRDNFMEFEVKGGVLNGVMSFFLSDYDTKVWKLIYEKTNG